MQPPILITGGAGFVGTNLATRYLKSGRRVLLFDNFARPGVRRNWEELRARFGERVELIEGDVRDQDALNRAVSRAEAVFHFAAQVAVTTSLCAPIEDFEINARGTLGVLEALRGHRDRSGRALPLLFTSTNKVYGGLEDLEMRAGENRYFPLEARDQNGVSEARALDFHSPYGCSKGAADQYVLDYARSFDLPACVFRMSCVYGPHQRGNEDQGWVAHFLLQALRDAPITLFGDGKQVRDLLFVEDLVDAMQLALERMETLRGRVFNIGGGPNNALSLLEVLDFIAQLHGEQPQILHDDWRVGDQKFYVSDTRAFETATGWRAQTAPREGIERLYRYFVESRAAETDKAETDKIAFNPS